MRNVLCLLAVLVLASMALAQTYVDEDISTDTTWTLSGSPYVIQADVWVESSSTLTIDPGVVVAFDGSYELSAVPGGNSIVAVGAPGSEILFTSHFLPPAPGDWRSVYTISSPASVFSHCVFEYGSTNLYVYGCDPTISSSTSRNASDCGIRCENASPEITGCNITDNDRGVWLEGPTSSPVIHECNILENPSANVYAAGYLSLPETVVVNAQNNWWGVDTELEILQTIDIWVPYTPYVEVDFDPWLHEVPVERTSWSAIKALFLE